ncbi:MAG: bifunctional D-glycero-beta-D-manno-heptose-7-phosphate kinase/D-glycero-beta-D-manno-heptose 1-phosphate adenylyltransferase HldE [Gammaproteobacteria bacterium]|nr:bifunctional D-glycero-beta-D-manno-heptose-7-phosphate kinase/D-glycero-beta-D-manno-heptose 1-phosphate adenylyltransferase HldE [Gammaproteobacteria bacterium]
MTLSVPTFSGARVLVAGDIMLDQYWFGLTARISPEAPVPVVRVRDSEDRPGGAANVAANLAALGVQTTLTGLTGDDAGADRLERMLSGQGVDCRFVRTKAAPTITKLRVLSRNQQLIRLDQEEAFGTAPLGSIAGAFEAALAAADVVILSDYGKGALDGVADLITLGRRAGKRILVDPKGEDFGRYRGASALTPNLGEFEAVVGHCVDDEQLVARGEALREELGIEFLLVTRSERGMTLIARGAEPLQLPAEAREVYDVTGAGDTVIALLGASLAAGLPAADAAALANLAAGLVVRRIGVASVTPSELRRELHQRGKGGRGLVTQEELVMLVREAQARSERVLMTNGCFDILHAGHVAYLEEAKSLGDRLVVAVNDDASVRHLKGDGRPVNPLADRMAVLAGLAAVDWVVSFAGETPEKLICEVLPDVLVKGGDYVAQDIAGGDCVRDNGGEVRVLGYHAGRSTTAMLEAMRGL